MPRAAKDNSQAAEWRNRVQLAVQRLADGTYASVSEAVDALKVSKSTLHRHLKGGLTRQQAHEKDQLLTRQEEKALANWITGATAMGNPVDRRYIVEMAQSMRENRRTALTADEAFLPPIGSEWIHRFLARHPHLCTRISKSIERARVSDVTTQQIMSFNQEFRQVIDENQIKQQHIYNCDETGTSVCFVYIIC